MLGSSYAHVEWSPVRGTELDDLDLDAVRDFVERRAVGLLAGRPLADVAVRLGLAAQSGTAIVPTPVGLLLFGLRPQLLHPEWGVLVARIGGASLSDPVTGRADLEGPLPVLLEGALAQVRAYTRSLSDQVASSGTYAEYPEAAVREAVVNALVHRDLRATGRVAVHIFDDRLVIHSPGGLPQGVPQLDELALEGGESLPRNPLLAAAARVLGIGEQVGRGLAVLRRAAPGGGEPVELVATPSEVRVVIPSSLRHEARHSALT